MNYLAKLSCLVHLPTIMNFDEFKATKDAKGKITFIITYTKSHKTFDISESRKSNYLKKYFFRFSRKQRLNLLLLTYLVLIMICLNLYSLMSLLYLIDFIL
jgi:transposase